MENRTCTCTDWEPCPCGNKDGSDKTHCMWCCLDLDDKQMALVEAEWEARSPSLASADINTRDEEN